MPGAKVLVPPPSTKADEIVTHFCEPIGHKQVSGDYVESWQPQPMSRIARERAEAIAAAEREQLIELRGVDVNHSEDKIAKIREIAED